MKRGSDWELDVGRYAYDKYATGKATNPQTNRSMTDHDVEFSCTRSLKGSSAATAARYARIADAFFRLGAGDAAAVFADKAIELAPLYGLPWDILTNVVEAGGDDRKLERILSRQAAVFQRFPDYLAEIRTRQAQVLRRLGRDGEAERMLNALENKLDDDREDLTREVALARVDTMLREGDADGARRKLEDLIKDQLEEGEKALSLASKYVDLTNGTGQQDKAVRFLKVYLDRINVTERGEHAANQILLRAYRNAGDERGAERLLDDMRD
jgi:tetratricopeptide (TPR) repeat protein